MVERETLNRKQVLLIILSAVVLLSGLLLLFAFLVSGEDPKIAGTIVFLGNEKIAPIVYAEKGVAKGVVVDIAKELGKKIGYRAIVKAMDWEVAQNKVLSGEADALLQINPNPERETRFAFSEKVLKSEFSIFVKSGSSIKTVDDLNGKSVGVEGGGYPFHLLQKYEGIKLVLITDWKAGFEKIESGELEAIVVDRWIGEYELARGKVTGVQVVKEPIEILHSRIAVKKGNEELLKLINTGLKKLNDDGTMAKILSNWQGKKVVYYTKETIRSTLLRIVLSVIILMLLLSLYWINRLSKLSKKLEEDVVQRTQELHATNELLRKANAKLERISIVDGLTNIANRRHFDLHLDEMWCLSMREKQPLALIMIDVDHFKRYNDTYGHLAGDQCLRRVAAVIRDATKNPGDLAARFGGEEFVVLLSNTDENGAVAVAERIRVNIEKLGIRNEELGTVITVSLGVVAMIPTKDITPEQLISAADRALYQSKKEGRNRVSRESLTSN